MGNRTPKIKQSIIGIVIPFLFILSIIVSVSIYTWYNNGIAKPNSTNNNKVSFKIESGTSALQIGQLLKEKGLISDLNIWQIFVKLNGPTFLADEYKISTNLNLQQVVEILQVGQKDQETSVTIPEGIRMDEIEAILDSKLTTFTNGAYNKEDFNRLINNPDNFLADNSVGQYILKIKPAGNSLEGFLFPDTYAFTKNITAEQVLLRLLTNFKDKTEVINPQNSLSFYENLVLSSIVEREASESDFTGVAGVFLTRLEIGEKLGSDITVLYILKRWKPEPDYNELNIDSPFNTRLNYGLPPTPVGNSGLSVIKATAEAKPSEYLFFLADDVGNIYYGKTLAEHEYLSCKYITKECY